MFRFRISHAVIVACLLVSSAMMHPTFTTLCIALPILVLLEFVLRYVSRMEAKADVYAAIEAEAIARDGKPGLAIDATLAKSGPPKSMSGRWHKETPTAL